jgi:deoxycytidylate deaminase
LENPKEIIAAYVPVLHRGYTDLFAAHPDAEIGVFDQTILRHIDYLRKDIRALQPESAIELLQGLQRPVHLLGERAFSEVVKTQTHLILPNDDVSKKALELYPPAYPETVTLEPVFLRWDRENTVTNIDVMPDRVINADKIPDTILEVLRNQASQSTSWWRHIGAAIVDKDSIVAASHNTSLPTQYSNYIDSDPRITAVRGQSIETSIDIHAESNLIAEVARHGHALEGTDLYVTTFPCPNCAKLIAASGIATCYFVEGYAMLDGYDVLKSAGVEIVKINADLSEGNNASRSIPYPSSQS